MMVSGAVLRRFSLIFSVFLAASQPADALETDWREKVLELQKIEQLMRASITTHDRDEMRRQIDAADRITEWLVAYPEKREIPTCGQAMFALNTFGLGMFGEDSAKGALERQRLLAAFQAHMSECEHRLGLPPTPTPNLR